MNIPSVQLGGANTDQAADEIISACLDPKSPKNFFLFAGAGSGKTRSLKLALEKFRNQHGSLFRKMSRKIAVITYTNAAAVEIAERVGSDSLFPISTIHSFCWTQINTFHADIQEWLKKRLPVELEEIQEKHAKGRSGKAAEDREKAMLAIQRRIEWLQRPRRFVYNPNGNNFGADSLSHSEVIKITADFLLNKPAMQSALVDQYPFLLIDESQDTNKLLLEAFLEIAKAHVGRFALGLFGDTMQRIYTDGHSRLGDNIPASWAKPIKQMNHRSMQRVVQLANAIRAGADGREQIAREDSKVGVVRLFIGEETAENKPALENHVRTRMAEKFEDPQWKHETQVKTLTLEHHMAASRRGFLPMFQALDSNSTLSTGLRSGELAGLRLFTHRVAPLIEASMTGNKFKTLSLLKAAKSPLLNESSLALAKVDDPLNLARSAVDALTGLLNSDPNISFMSVLKCVADHNLFDVPTALLPFITDIQSKASPSDSANESSDIEEATELSPSSLEAWRTFLDTPYSQIIPYAEYVADKGPYGTHQGVKGLEFERVMVIIDDSEAKGFLFSYGKLFGTEPLTANDHKRIAEGEDTGNDRTRRLLYVTCTRAQASLALVIYTPQREALAQAVLKQGWFQPDEIEMIN